MNLEAIIHELFHEINTVWVQFRTQVLWVLMWAQTVCKGYQQTTTVAGSRERVKLAHKDTSTFAQTHYLLDLWSYERDI